MITWELALIIAAIALSLITLLLFFWCLKRLNQHEATIGELQQSNESLTQRLAAQNEEIHELRSGAMGVASKVKEMSGTLRTLAEKVQELEFMDPEVRLYAQATKMAQAGASVDELMQECELPRAEAELLVSVNASNRS